MTSYYESIGLPVWTIESYQDLLDHSESDLIDKYRSMSVGFSNEAIWADFWIKKIKSNAESLKIDYFEGKHISPSEKEA